MRLGLLVFLGLLLAQEPEPSAAGSGRIAGTVRNAETGVPLKGATVTLSPPPLRDPKPISAVTGEDGRFVLEGLPAGNYSVIATLPGFALPDAAQGTFDGRGPYINLANQRTENVTIRLAPTVSVSGRVLDSNGQPSTLLAVMPAQKTYDANGFETMTPVPAGYGRPDENGAYRISGLLPGVYYIMTQESGGLRTYYPGVQSLSEAVPVVVSGSDLGGIDFRIVPTDKYAVRFRVTGIFPAPTELNFLLSGVPATTVPTPADGWFTIPLLPPRDYNLTIQWTDSPSDPTAPATLLGRHNVSFTVTDRDLDLGTITVQPPITVAGRVTFKSGAPFPLNVILRSEADRRALTSKSWLSEENDFDISLVPEGRYTVGTSALPEGQYLAAATYNTVDVLGRRISINGTTDGRLDLVIDGPAGKISGVVVDAKSEPVSNATVVLLPPLDRRETLDSSFVAKTDQTGRFTIDRVAPGEYNLLSWEVMPQYAYKNADWIKNYETRGLHVSVRKGETFESVLKVIPRTP